MASYSGRSTYCTESPSTPAEESPSRMASTMAVLDSFASVPPRRITALPDFRQSAAASRVTFGRDS